MQKVFYKNLLLGIKIGTFAEGINPITKGDEPLQLLTIKHKKGKTFNPHLHASKLRTIEIAETCFVVKKGKVLLDVFNPKKKFVETVELHKGDIFITTNGSGHGLRFVKNSEVIEIKNGPFIEDKIVIE